MGHGRAGSTWADGLRYRPVSRWEELYSINHSFSVHVIQASSMRAVEVVIGGLASWEKPHYGALAADGSLLLPFQGRTLARLDPVAGTTRLEPRTAIHTSTVPPAPKGAPVCSW